MNLNALQDQIIIFPKIKNERTENLLSFFFHHFTFLTQNKTTQKSTAWNVS